MKRCWARQVQPIHCARGPARVNGFGPGAHPEERLRRVASVLRPIPIPINCGSTEPGYQQALGSAAACWSATHAQNGLSRLLSDGSEPIGFPGVCVRPVLPPRRTVVWLVPNLAPSDPEHCL